MNIIKQILQNYKLNISIKEDISSKIEKEINSILDDQIEILNKVTDPNNPESEISKFNNSIVQFNGSKEFFNFLKDAIYWFGATDGIFNPFAIVIEKSFKNIMDGEWKDEKLFKLNKINFDFPKNISEVGEFLEIDYVNMKINILRKTYLDLSGINKGIFIDKISSKINKYIDNYSISFGGDSIYVCGDEVPWEIGINNPVTKEKDGIQLEVANQAVSISGYKGQKNVVEDMNSYLLLDPKKENKLSSRLSMVIVKSNNSTTSDVLAKSFIISNKKQRHNLQQKFPNASRIEVDNKGKVMIIS